MKPPARRRTPGGSGGFLSFGTLIQYDNYDAGGASLFAGSVHSDNYWRAPSAISGILTNATIYLAKVGSPTGNLTVVVKTDAGVLIDTSTAIDVSTLTGTAAPYGVTFAGGKVLDQGVFYRYHYIYTGGDGSNYVLMSVNDINDQAGYSMVDVGANDSLPADMILNATFTASIP